MMHILCFLPTYACAVILLTNYGFLPVGRVSGMISRSHRVLRVKNFVYTSWGALVLSNYIYEYIRYSLMLLTLMPG